MKKRGRPKKTMDPKPTMTSENEELNKIEKELGQEPEKKPDSPTPPESFEIDAKTLEDFIAMPFNIMALRTQNEKWRLTPAELKQITPFFERVSNKYLPQWMIKFSDEIVIGIVLGNIILKRINFETPKKEPEKPVEKTPADQPDQNNDDFPETQKTL